MLGVLGGMGPMATVDFMAKLVAATPASCDQDHPGVLVLQASDIPDRTRAILGQGPDPLPAMLAGLRRLEAAGATHLAMPCNTAHHWHAALQAATQRPILHIVDAVAAAARSGCWRRTERCGPGSTRSASPATATAATLRRIRRRSWMPSAWSRPAG